MNTFSVVIPVLLGGKRLTDKNLIMLDGQPLCSYVVNTAVETVSPDSVYVLYEDRIVKNAISITEPFPKPSFVKRDPTKGGSRCTMSSLSSDCRGQRCQVHDHYLYDLFQKLDTDWVVQLHTTSPLISPKTLRDFIDIVQSSCSDMIISVVNTQKECFVGNKPANFDINRKMPTQDLAPVKTICWGLTAWRRQKFIETYNSGKSPSFLENFDTYSFPADESDDIDTLEELMVVEQRLRGRRLAHSSAPLLYFDSKYISIERELHKLLDSDGSALSETALYNMFGKISLSSIIEEMGSDRSWSYPIMVDGQDQACLIQQVKGDQCRKHFHITKSEFWAVLQGAFEWILEDQTHYVKKGEFMRLKPGQVHIIRSVSDQPGIRLAMGGYNMEHVYV